MNNFLLDLLPVLLFFIVFKYQGIYAATWVGIIATFVQVCIYRLTTKRWDKMQLVTLAIFLTFGGMTLYFHDPIFVKWKPTIIFWIFGLAFYISQFVGKESLVQRMMSHAFEGKATVSKKTWHRLNLAWSLFFFVLGA